MVNADLCTRVTIQKWVASTNSNYETLNLLLWLWKLTDIPFYMGNGKALTLFIITNLKHFFNVLIFFLYLNGEQLTEIALKKILTHNRRTRMYWSFKEVQILCGTVSETNCVLVIENIKDEIATVLITWLEHIKIFTTILVSCMDWDNSKKLKKDNTENM